jgi:predicted nucleic acid-binding protein
MIVVADTSPLNYLALIGEIELLAALYETVLIPEEVHQELLRDQAPPAVRMWAASLPAWCKVRSVNPSADPVLSELDPGERDAILLALESGIDTLLIDEISGRREAARHRLHVVGTVALLEKAAQRGLIDFRKAFQSLEQTNFRLATAIRDEFLRRNP